MHLFLIVFSSTSCLRPDGERTGGQEGPGWRWAALEPTASSREDAIERAQQLRAVLEELAGLSARKIAAALNERKIVTPTGGVWHAATVIRVQKRLRLA